MNLIYYYLSYKPPWIQASPYASSDPKTPYEDVQCISPVLISGSLRYPHEIEFCGVLCRIFYCENNICVTLFL